MGRRAAPDRGNHSAPGRAPACVSSQKLSCLGSSWKLPGVYSNALPYLYAHEVSRGPTTAPGRAPAGSSRELPVDVRQGTWDHRAAITGALTPYLQAPQEHLTLGGTLSRPERRTRP